MRGTFFVNSDNIDTEGYLSRRQLRKLDKSGHEIGGHTKSGPHLSRLTTEQIVDEICNDRNTIMNWVDNNKNKNDGGDSVTSISWPYGDSNTTIENIAAGCGYIRGRDVGGIKVQTSCSLCPTSVDLPTTLPLRN